MKRTFLLTALAVSLAACNKGGIEGVQTFDYKGGEHREGQIQYAQTPPAGGPHNPTWQTCAVYDQPIYNEYGVHSLEHGAVWVTYRADLGADAIAKLKTLVDGHSYALLSPYPDLPHPVVISAWNAQLAVDSADDNRLKAFLDKYEQGSNAPERGASCTGFNGTQGD
ncbi:DUF3105 domain-containing protein [Deinococcus maricopensis]|jgi:Protein of unknown function (DUF3105)|uniref:DUF3105 domain-containing protein n=1 Tax=Deinococcus maricopensis (strain DSM 21211 / LMG 22137 / NRRL B-23946 / LB-34) TaxID=709986 RepID=E8UC23_DEIML|nr:DUF3105 domain-containing protein [Deinococcus maricopensis]ADV68684.1 hypothetical protein Deima_3055 [Deinococcus maricopensis DSM 21211]